MARKPPTKPAKRKAGIGHNSNGRVRDARIGPLYRTYGYRLDRDPVMDLLKKARVEAKIKTAHVHRDTGVSTSAIYNWDNGKTVKPQFATVVAVARSIPGALEQVEALIRRGK
jgi:DNA-binding XRE family transcriptional regulator